MRALGFDGQFERGQTRMVRFVGILLQRLDQQFRSRQICHSSLAVDLARATIDYYLPSRSGQGSDSLGLSHAKVLQMEKHNNF